MASKVHIEPATAEHARELAPSMREEDVAEVDASCGATPLGALEQSIAGSEAAYAVYFGGELAVVWGHAPAPWDERVGLIWALTGSAVARHKRAFLRESRRAIALALARYPVIANWVDARYSAALRWLSSKSMGFEVLVPEPFGVARLPFHAVIRRRS